MKSLLLPVPLSITLVDSNAADLFTFTTTSRSTTLQRLIARCHTSKRQWHLALRIIPMQFIHAILRLHAIERCGNRTVFAIQHDHGTVEIETGSLSRDIACAVVGWEKANASVGRGWRGNEESCIRPGGIAGSGGGVGVSNKVSVGIECN